MSDDVYWRPNERPRATWYLLGLAVGVLAVSPQSYWVDETVSVGFAMQPTLTAAAARIYASGS